MTFKYNLFSFYLMYCIRLILRIFRCMHTFNHDMFLQVVKVYIYLFSIIGAMKVII